MRGIILCSAVTGILLVSSAAADVRIPSQYHGVWEPTTIGNAPDCDPGKTDQRITIADRRVDFHEGICVPRRIKPAADKAIELRSSCEQEDSKYTENARWSLREINGTIYLSIKSLNPGNPYNEIHGRCPASAPQKQEQSKKQDGSACYRQGMSEFKLTTFDNGKAEFEIQSAQANAHICGLEGTASSIRNGYRYTEKLESGATCQLSMLFDNKGNVRFEDQDESCKRFYCGARAYFSTIRFASSHRVKCE